MRNVFLLLVLAATRVHAAEPMSVNFQPDPLSVQRYGPAYRYPQAGWIVLHTEGEPYERGYQHGKLMTDEIAAHVRCFAAVQNPPAPTGAWKQTRTLVNALFLRRFHPEYLEEMKGIADGAAAGGARFDNRPIDIVDIAALNVWPEVHTLDSALEATPLGLEGKRFPREGPKVMPAPKGDHCSAFAATGPATADGKIVFGHITMFSLYPSNFYNVWLDIKPAKGHRVMMQSYPGGMQSGMDYYMNDAGLLITETTIRQTRFDVQGLCLASRIREAMQYADSIDRAVEILEKSNNGLYTNEWLLGDTKTNEIAMFELGTHKSKLYRSSKNEWFGDTPGFYWGCNNTKDMEVRLETVASPEERPANVVFHPADRDRAWLRMYAKYKGKINADFAREAFTMAPLAAYHSLDAKFTTTALAASMKTCALFGAPLGPTWQPTFEERQHYPEVQPLVNNPWCVLHGGAPAPSPKTIVAAVDLQTTDSAAVAEAARRENRHPSTVPAWHGTILPKSAADTWLATAFADYEKIVALETALLKDKEKLSEADHDRIAVALYQYRSEHLAAARVQGPTALSKTRTDLKGEEWYRMAAGKGVLLLQDLRRLMGDSAFTDMMESFGRTHAGQRVSAAEFQAHVAKASGKNLNSFFADWLEGTDLPQLQLRKVEVTARNKGFLVQGEIQYTGRGFTKMPVVLAMTTPQGEVFKTIHVENGLASFSIETNDRPTRLTVDPHQRIAKANGGVYSIHSWFVEPEQTLIVYGTADEVWTNREAAEELQQSIREYGKNHTVPIKSDKEVTKTDLSTHHLILIGRPDSNSVVASMRASLPVSFGSHSFRVRGVNYAHAESAVIAASENPVNRRFAVVVVAGLNGASTRRAGIQFLRGSLPPGEVVVLAHGRKPHALVVPAPELVKEWGDK